MPKGKHSRATSSNDVWTLRIPIGRASEGKDVRNDSRALLVRRSQCVGSVRTLGVWLLIGAVTSGCLRQHGGQGTNVPAVLRAAFLDVRRELGSARIVVGPFRLSADPAPRVWERRDLAQVLADTSTRLGRAVIRGRTLEGHPLPWAPDSGEVGVSFSDPEFEGDTARVLVRVVAPAGESFSAALSRITLIRSGRDWTVTRREQLSTT